jgi:fucokinase
MKPPIVSPFQGLLTRAAETYKRALIGHQRGLTWDYVVLTAANEHQAAGYRHEIALRSNPEGPFGPFFPPSQQTLVVADPPAPKNAPAFRVGSGGGTFHVLRAIAAHEKSLGNTRPRPFDALRILIIHSGGASQRLPLYSPLGKIFTPLPLVRPDGQLMTLFDHLYLLMAALPARLGPGMLVAAGDVFLLFDGAAVSPPPPGVTALTMRAPVALAQAHGIFKTDAASPKSMPFPLATATLQKATIQQARSAGFADGDDQVLIDSGLLFFDAPASAALYALSKKYTPAWHARTRHAIDLYTDIAPAALAVEGPILTGDPVLRKLQRDLRRALAGSPLRCHELAEGHFQHIGTTRQFRDVLTGLDPTPACTLFHQNVRFSSAAPIPPTARVYQSVIASPGARLAECTVVENCLLPAPISVGRGSILSNVQLSPLPMSPTPGGNGARKAPKVPPETLVFGVPVLRAGKTARLTVIMGVNDDFKTLRTLCNIDLGTWLTRAGLSDADLWPGDTGAPRSLWTARLYRPVEDPAAPLADLEWMTAPQRLTDAMREAWRRAVRYSMADILEHADAAAMAAHRDALSGTLQATQWIDAVRRQTAASVHNAVHHFGTQGYQRLFDTLHLAAGDPGEPPLTRARMFWSLAEMQSRPTLPKNGIKFPAPTSALQRRAFDAIREAMTPPEILAFRSQVAQPAEITASAPVRLDFAGGWTDTPPYCLENGGAVLNVAVNLNDVEPIQSTFRPLAEPVVRLVSRDLGKTLLITSPEDLMRPLDPGDPFALHLAALRLTGLGPSPRETSMKKYLARLRDAGRSNKKAGGLQTLEGGGGFELTTAANLPKGSGMGTSSILGATALATLRTAAGLDTASATLFEQTLLLEQHLGTGGGWQDQVGGIVGGAKITTTAPGIPQKLQVRKIPLSPALQKALEERLVVYFTGQQRLARNILREVMGRYLSREPGTMVLFNELVHAARACEGALRRSDWFSVAAEINHYWRIKKDLFPGSTTPATDALFLELRPYYLAGSLTGAGGGGFAFFLCRDADQAHRLRTELARISMRPGSLGLTFSATLNLKGLRVASRGGAGS